MTAFQNPFTGRLVESATDHRTRSRAAKYNLAHTVYCTANVTIPEGTRKRNFGSIFLGGLVYGIVSARSFKAMDWQEEGG